MSRGPPPRPGPWHMLLRRRLACARTRAAHEGCAHDGCVYVHVPLPPHVPWNLVTTGPRRARGSPPAATAGPTQWHQGFDPCTATKAGGHAPPPPRTHVAEHAPLLVHAYAYSRPTTPGATRQAHRGLGGRWASAAMRMRLTAECAGPRPWLGARRPPGSANFSKGSNPLRHTRIPAHAREACWGPHSPLTAHFLQRRAHTTPRARPGPGPPPAAGLL